MEVVSDNEKNEFNFTTVGKEKNNTKIKTNTPKMNSIELHKLIPYY